MRSITVTKIVLDKDERKIQKTWKDVWSRMKNEEKKFGTFNILFGDWSGYNSAQYQITHVDLLPHHDAMRLGLSQIRFTDGTTMSVWKKQYTMESLIKEGLKRKLTYTSLLEKAIASGEAYYDIAGNKI